MFEKLESPIDEKEKQSLKDTSEEMAFFLTVTPKNNNHLITFKNGTQMEVTKKDIIEMINQLSLGLMWD